MSTDSELSSEDGSFVCLSKNCGRMKQIVIDFVIWCIASLPLLVLFVWGTPNIRGFYCDDLSIRLPYKQETISNTALMITGLVIPLALMAMTELLGLKDKTKCPGTPRYDLILVIKAYSFFLFGTVINKTTTEFVKYNVGRLRPNFIDVCRPDFSRINCSQGWITEYTCTNTDHSWVEVRGSRLSFPSGHASYGVFCAVYAVLYLQERLQISSSYFLKPFIQSSVLMLSIWCCITRISDNKHFPSDVIAGSIMGIVAAWLTFYKVACPVIMTSQAQRRRSGIDRLYSVNSAIEPATPEPLLRTSKDTTCSIYLADRKPSKDRCVI